MDWGGPGDGAGGGGEMTGTGGCRAESGIGGAELGMVGAGALGTGKNSGAGPGADGVCAIVTCSVRRLRGNSGELRS
jgi:hypothetical protein